MQNVIKKMLHQWLWLVLILFCVIGFFYPIIGLAAIVCMISPSLYAAVKKNRGWCGGYCPRGSFNDMIMPKISRNKGVPAYFKTGWFRLLFFGVLMLAFVIQLVLAWGDMNAIGMVFVRMVVITTLLTLILGMVYQARAWCIICPMGTMAHYVIQLRAKKGSANPVAFSHKKCIDCQRCSKSCPMGIDVLSFKGDGYVKEADCLRCGICIKSCPKNALDFVS